MKNDYAYYFMPKKMIRDLVHEYVNLTEFELKIIDNASFQRLKDIRQLTCQEVYPSARHTRFEHSLGVLELTRQAIKHLNQNKFLPDKNKTMEQRIIGDQLQLNATLAALLHDVGHCMFSHLGEKEFDEEKISYSLIEEIERFEKDHNSSFSRAFINYINDTKLKGIGSKHEKISCYVILSKFEDLLLENNLTTRGSDPQVDNLFVDFELIIRSILGIRYTWENGELRSPDSCKYNVIVHLINDRIFDMDKLDYIMRDTVFTGINVGRIDTQRLFRNMYFEDNESFSLVFSSKAVPALQNFIDARDTLYMYVYNHHVSILADFLNTYIIRRLARNADKFLHLVDLTLKSISSSNSKYTEIKESVWENDYIYALGLVPRSYIFSLESIIGENRSDSDWISLVNTIYTRYSNSTSQSIRYYLMGLMKECYYNGWKTAFPNKKCNLHKGTKICSRILDSKAGVSLIDNLQLTYKIIFNYKNRMFLKPWWKTLSQFSIFLEKNYRDVSFNGSSHEDIRSKICQMITYGTKKIQPDQLRAQIAKLVVLIADKIYSQENLNHSSTPKILERLDDGDFFICERSTRFNEIENIRKLRIVLGLTELEKSQNRKVDYITKSLDDIIPQKDYKSIYNKESFYVYSKPLSDKNYCIEHKREHYRCIEQIFVYSTIKFLETNESQLEKCFGEKSDNEAKKAFFDNCANIFLSNYYYKS